MIFVHMSKEIYWFVMYINDRQQDSPTLRLLLVLEKRLVHRINYLRHYSRTKHQHKTIPSYSCTAGFKVSTINL
jgi:hypothetical protein